MSGIFRLVGFNGPIPRNVWLSQNLTASASSSLSRSAQFHLFYRHRKTLTISFCAPYSSSSSFMEAPPPGYRKNVGICLTNAEKKIFAASRLDVPNAWQMPQGGINNDEDPKDAAIRELREETGVCSAQVLAEASLWLTYDFPPEVREKLNRQWGSDWKGQAQKWYLLKFTGEEEEINLGGDGSEKPEFGKWAWLSPEAVFERAVDFKKPVYEQVMKIFSPHLH